MPIGPADVHAAAFISATQPSTRDDWNFFGGEQAIDSLVTFWQAIMALGVLAALGMAPAALQRPALELFSRKASAVATNVPGPQQPLFLAGSELRELMFWVPQTGSIGLGLSILSYNGRVHFGLIADAKRIADPDAIVQRFGAEFEKLVMIALMEEWGGDITAADAAATLARYGVDAEVLGTSRRSRRKTAAASRVRTPSASTARRKAKT